MSIKYELTLLFDATALTNIFTTRQAVAIVKQVGSTVPAPYAVAWVLFQPFTSNVITWTESYALYATPLRPRAGEALQLSALWFREAKSGWTYSYENKQFTGVSGGPEGTFTVVNRQAGSMTFGLAQNVDANGTPYLEPVNGVALDFDDAASFTPATTISIFLAPYPSRTPAHRNHGVVLESVPANLLTVALTPAAPAATIGFDTKTSAFYLAR